LAAIAAIPVLATLAGRPLPRTLLRWLIAFAGVRIVLWIGRDLLFTHDLDADGLPVYGPLVFPTALPLMAGAAGYLVHASATWADHRERRLVLAGTFTALAHDAAVTAALAESERRHRLALEAGELGTFEADEEHGVATWSPCMEHLHGLAVGSFDGSIRTALTLIHPDDRDVARSWLAEVRRAGVSRPLDYRVRDQDGATRWLEARASTLGDGRMIGVVRDVTDRRIAEDRWRHEARHDALTGLAAGAGSRRLQGRQRLAAALAAPLDLDGCEHRVGGSIGIARSPDHGDEPDVLLRRADAAMYLAKATGGTWRHWEDEDR
jgi:PAS domain S-box-containing protein